jgi:hypothetical protein
LGTYVEIKQPCNSDGGEVYFNVPKVFNNAGFLVERGRALLWVL